MRADEAGKLADLYGTEVYRFCLRLSGSRPDGEDLYQQTFLRLLEMQAVPDWNRNPRAFLFSVAHGIWRNLRRKQMRRERIAPEISAEEPGFVISASVDTEEQVLVRMWEADIRHAVQNLPDRYRLPVILFYTFGLKTEDIAVVLKVPSGTVKSRLHKGRALIRQRLEEIGYEQPERV